MTYDYVWEGEIFIITPTGMIARDGAGIEYNIKFNSAAVGHFIGNCVIVKEKLREVRAKGVTMINSNDVMNELADKLLRGKKISIVID